MCLCVLLCQYQCVFVWTFHCCLLQWNESLPLVTPFYGELTNIITSLAGYTCFPHSAVKCNYDPVLLQTLAALGTGFDCASKREIETILNLGVDPSRIIYANPCKQNSYIRLVIVLLLEYHVPRIFCGQIY